MPLTPKAVRELVGFTFPNVGSDPQMWFKLARQFNSVAILINHHYQSELIQGYCLNVGLSLELALKAIIIAKSKSIEPIHKLNDLLKEAEINITKDQECTLELLTESIVWSGRYPTPKKEVDWDRYHDNVVPKHTIVKTIGNTNQTLKNESRFPTHANCQALWKIFENEFIRLQNN